MRKTAILVSLMAWASACAAPSPGALSERRSPEEDDPSAAADEADGGTTDASVDARGRDEAGKPAIDASTTDAAVQACPDRGSVDLASQPKLQSWLQKRAYECWSRESVVHPSAGPHNGNVRTYVNDVLDASLSQGKAEHPAGAMAVKELYGKGKTAPFGWAVGIKTQAQSKGGAGWYWYEVFDTSQTTTNFIAGQNHSTCTPCHSDGKDFVLAPYPLQ